MRVGVQKESAPGERRVVVVPRDVAPLIEKGHEVRVQAGGNCELTEPGKTIEAGGVTIHGPLNLPSTMPFHTSRMYSKNITTFLAHVLGAGSGGIDFEDEIVRATCLAHEGEVRIDE